MSNLFRSVITHLRGKAYAGRNVLVLPNDVFLVSYPRSGNTWTRFLIANLLHPNDPVTFVNIDRKVADIYTTSQEALLQLPRPRILKSHEPFDPRYRNVIYIVRDPRDVAVSYYHWKLKRRVIQDGYPMEQFVSGFVGAEFDLSVGTWGQNVATWLAARQHTSGFILLRYEDLLLQPERELERIAKLLRLSVTPTDLARAVTLSSAKRMRGLEKQQTNLWKGGKGFRQDKMFVRSCNAGGWKSELSERSISEIESAWGPVMQMVGYELTTSKPTAPTLTTAAVTVA